MFGRVAVAGTIAVSAVAANGAGAGNEPDPGLGSLVSALRANGAEIVPLGQRGGLDGYLVAPAGGGGYSLYVTGDGHAVAGVLYGPDGTELTGAQLAAAGDGGARAGIPGTAPPERVAAPGPATAHAESERSGDRSSSSASAALFERSAAAFGFTLGGRGPAVVLLGDATCSWSRAAAAKLGRAALDGRLRLRVVPVAVLGGEAARRAAAIAAHPQPARAWFEGGGTAGRTLGPGTGAERIARNNALFDAWGATAVPLIAWRTRDGAVAHQVGDIDDIEAWLKNALGREAGHE
jgi:hypothetical protein